ncbi:MAG TPA: preprotein translocase subunit YajC [Atopobiaceae bacterium]|nr:preprotein translocase subunit YajC [Atopobiaceae bacterium]
MSIESILSSCVALLILTAAMGVVYAIYSAVKARKQKDYFAEIHRELAVGQRVAFAGGLYGKLVRVGKETCDVEIKSGVVVEVSRYAIQKIVK